MLESKPSIASQISVTDTIFLGQLWFFPPMRMDYHQLPTGHPHSKMRSAQEHRSVLVAACTNLHIISIQSHVVCTVIKASMHVRETLL